MAYLVKPGTSAEDLAAQREFAQSLLANASSTKPVGHWTNILAQMAQGAMGGYEAYELGQEGRRQQAEAGDLFDKAIQSLAGTGGATPGGSAPAAPATPMPVSPATQAAAAAGRDVAPTMGLAGDPLQMIRKEEGFAPQAKWDYRQYSGGYGSRAAPGETFTREKAEQRLQQDAAPVVDWVQRNAPNATPDQKRALVSFGYNLGTDDLDKLKPDIDRGDWMRVGQRLLSFNRAGGEVNAGLVGRRAREAALIRGEGAPTETAAAPAATARNLRLQSASDLYRNPLTRPMAGKFLEAEMTRQAKKPEVVAIELGNGQKRSMLQMPDGTLQPIDMSKFGQSNELPPNFEDSQKLRKEFTAQANVKKFTDSIGPYQSMLKSAPIDTAVADVDMLYGLATILDPESVVREGEYATLTKTQSLPEQLRGEVLRAMSGQGRLSQETRAKIMDIASNRVGSYRERAGADVERFTGLAKRYGMDRNLVVQDLPELQRYQAPAIQPGQPGGTRPAPIRVERGPDGQLRRAQ